MQSSLFTGKTTERPRDNRPPAWAARPAEKRDDTRLMMAGALPEVGRKALERRGVTITRPE